MILSDSTQLVSYTTADQLAAVYRQKSAEVLELASRLQDAMSELSDTFGDSDFNVQVTVCRAEKPENYARELKRTAWRHLVGKLGIEKAMSSSRKEELRAALNRDPGWRRDMEDPIDALPEIDPDNIFSVLSGFAASADEFLDEAIQEEYEWLKPGYRDEYKTNEQNRWKLGRKIVISYAVERYSFGFSINYNKQAHLQSLDNIFHMLDGKGIPKDSHHGPLVSAITGTRETNTPFETEYFRFKCFKNGNLHLEFRRPDLVDEFNLRCGNKHELPDLNATSFQRGDDTDKGQPPIVAPNGNYEFFETPEKLAREICETAGITEGDRVLEPSAGQGRIARVARDMGGDVLCCEIQFENLQSLDKQGFLIQGGNFLAHRPVEHFDVVVMNPPFSHSQDVLHIQHAFKFLKPGGRLVAVASSGVKFRQDKKSAGFREWVKELGGVITELPDGSFSESGTEVCTVLVSVAKPDVTALN